MRVLMLLGNPFTSDPRVYAEATSLIKAGHEVIVIARDTEGRNPLRQNWDGIDVVRTRTRLRRRYGLAWWWWNRCEALSWERSADRQALILHKDRRFGAVHCHDLDTLAIGIRLKRKLGIPLVYDAHEICGYAMMAAVPRWRANMLLKTEERLLREVDRIINVGEPQKRYFEAITDKPITIVMNCKPLGRLEHERPANELLTVLYIGALQQDRAILMLVRAARDLSGVRCLIAGAGQPGYVEALKEAISEASNVSFLGKVPFDEVIPMTMKADVVFCMVNPEDRQGPIGMPNKLFEAMACGRPVLCTKGTYSGEVTEREQVGLAVEHDEQALREAIVRLRDDAALRERLGRSGVRAAMTKYNWAREEEKLLELYRDLNR